MLQPGGAASNQILGEQINKNHWFAWRANQWPVNGETLLSSVPPSNSLVLVLDPRRTFWADTAPFKGPLCRRINCFRAKAVTQGRHQVCRASARQKGPNTGRALNSPRALLSELYRNKDIVRCGPLGATVQGHHQNYWCKPWLCVWWKCTCFGRSMNWRGQGPLLQPPWDWTQLFYTYKLSLSFDNHFEWYRCKLDRTKSKALSKKQKHLCTIIHSSPIYEEC